MDGSSDRFAPICGFCGSICLEKTRQLKGGDGNEFPHVNTEAGNLVRCSATLPIKKRRSGDWMCGRHYPPPYYELPYRIRSTKYFIIITPYKYDHFIQRKISRNQTSFPRATPAHLSPSKARKILSVRRLGSATRGLFASSSDRRRQPKQEK